MMTIENRSDPTEAEISSLELAAMRAAYVALEGLSGAGRARALRWLFDALGVGICVQLSGES